MFEKLDTLESGLSKGTLKSKAVIITLLEGIEKEALVKGYADLKHVTSSILSDLRQGMLLKALRQRVRDEIGPIHSALSDMREQEVPSDVAADKAAFRRRIYPTIRRLAALNYHPEVPLNVYGAMVKDILDNVPQGRVLDYDALERHINLVGRQLGIEYQALLEANVSSKIRAFARKVANGVLQTTANDNVDRQVSSAYQDQVMALPRSVENFAVAYAPVVPMFAGAQPTSKLKKSGLSVVSLVDAYDIIENQTLLIVNKHNIEPDEALANVNRNSKVQYVLASHNPRPNPNNAKLLMYWIMPRQKLNDLQRSIQWNLTWDVPRL